MAPPLGFWLSDAVLVAVQAALVCGPRPRLPTRLRRLRGSVWAWLLLPVPLVATVVLLAVVPGLGVGYAWLALFGVPVLAAIAVASWVRAPLVHRAAVGAVVAAAFLVVAADVGPTLLRQGAAVTLTALSAGTLASYLRGLAGAPFLRAGIVVMAVLDAILVFGQLLEGPNDTLNAAVAAPQLPQLQAAYFGDAVLGYGDLFAAAVLGTVLAGLARRRTTALLVAAVSVVFDLLFLVVTTLPATVPVALVLLGLLARASRSSSRGRPARR